jgi:hypothetical protein
VSALGSCSAMTSYPPQAPPPTPSPTSGKLRPGSSPRSDSRAPRPRLGWKVWMLLAALGVISLSLLGLDAYVNPPPGSNCLDWYVYCPGGPGETPLGTALSIGNGTGACVAGNGSTLQDCAYSFALETYSPGSNSAPVPSARDLSFDLLNSTGASLNSNYLVILTNPGDGWIGTWNSSSLAWTSSNQRGSCGVTDCLSAPMETGDSLLLRSIPRGGLPYSHDGDSLVATAVGGGFAGTVDAPIE